MFSSWTVHFTTFNYVNFTLKRCIMIISLQCKEDPFPETLTWPILLILSDLKMLSSMETSKIKLS